MAIKTLFLMIFDLGSSIILTFFISAYLVWICSSYSMVPVPGSDEEIRLIDDGFVKICNMMNDISVKVRTKAASLLGSLHQVSPKFLEQTLDKKLMSNMRVSMQ